MNDVIDDAFSSTATVDTPSNYVASVPLDSVEVTDDVPVRPSLWHRIEVHWPLGDRFYAGVVKDVQSNMHHITYDDGDSEQLDLASEAWRSLPALVCSTACPGRILKSSDQAVLSSMLQMHGN